jgi:hypothetical protein
LKSKPGELTVSEKTIKRFLKRIARLYEQGADSIRIGQYVLKWLQWLLAGVEQLAGRKSRRKGRANFDPASTPSVKKIDTARGINPPCTP